MEGLDRAGLNPTPNINPTLSPLFFSDLFVGVGGAFFREVCRLFGDAEERGEGGPKGDTWLTVLSQESHRKWIFRPLTE